MNHEVENRLPLIKLYNDESDYSDTFTARRLMLQETFNFDTGMSMEQDELPSSYAAHVKIMKRTERPKKKLKYETRACSELASETYKYQNTYMPKARIRSANDQDFRKRFHLSSITIEKKL